MKIRGETQGLKKSILDDLQALYDRRVPQDMLWTKELIEETARISFEINREIALYLDRKGRITDISVGDSRKVSLSPAEGRRSLNRLSGIRCIHTHPNAGGLLSPVDISSLKMLRLDAMIAVGVQKNKEPELYAGIISCENSAEVTILGPYSPDKQDFSLLLDYMARADKNLGQTLPAGDDNRERAVLVGLDTRDSRDLNGVNEAEVSLAELEELTKTAGAIVAGRIMQKRETRDSSTVLGQGKIEELRLLAQSLEANLVIFDEELSAAQQRNIEEEVGLKTICRTDLILDIFAQRARSREGILQVELAQLEYRLPRLRGMGLALSRLGGGIGTRGPGETKLEVDRRRIRRRIVHLKKQLADIRKQRAVLREKRSKNGIPVTALVGYTNAGKSTLLNALCQADVLAEDKLFATLDPTTRQLVLAGGSRVLLTDTVGFIRKLPHNLLDAFKSTLEEVVLSDLIIIVADASDPQLNDQVRIVDEILTQLGAGTKPTLIALNKTDLVSEESSRLLRDDRPVIEISAKTGYGLDELKQAIEKILSGKRIRVPLTVSLADGATMAWLHANSRIIEMSYDENNFSLEVELDISLLPRIKDYVLL